MYHFRLWPERMKRFTDWATKAGLRSTTPSQPDGTGSNSAAKPQNKSPQRRPLTAIRICREGLCEEHQKEILLGKTVE